MNTTMLRATLAAGLALLSLGSGPVYAAEYWLRADAATVTMPGAAPIPVWAFAQCADATFATCAPASVPGPALVVPPGEGLTVNVRNNLPEPVSLVIPGQVATMTPVWADGTSGPRASLTARVRSFTYEAAPLGGNAAYSWPALKHGTYLYHSGTHPQVQVQMGLYGAVTKDFAAGEAYPGVVYDAQVTLLYSEIDPALHAAIAGPTPTYGTLTGPTSTIDYVPRWFLVNGKPYSAGDPAIAALAAGKRTLLRFINAGLRTRVPVTDGPYMQMIAEDGNPYPWPANPRTRYSVFLPAAKTMDTLLVPPGAAAGGPTRIAFFDRTGGLTNDRAVNGGMLAFFDVGDAGSAPTITSSPPLAATVGRPYSYAMTATDPDGGVLAYSLVAAPAGMTIDPATGLVSWTPAAAQLGNNAVTVRVTDPTARFSTQSFTVVVASDPTAHAPVITSAPVTSATYGLAYAYPVTATDADGGVLTYSLDLAPAGMTIDAASGAISWTPVKSQVGANNVTVRVTDPTSLFGQQSYSVNVANANYPPVAANDAYNMIQGGVLNVAAPGVLANDSDPDADPMTAAVVGAPVGGGLVLDANGGFTYTPAGTVTGTRTFTYQARDAATASNTATVTITIATNKPPVAANDTYIAAMRTTPAYTAVLMAVLANDSDPDTALDSTNRINAATVTIPTVPNKGGTAIVNANGTISYTPKLNFRGTENFQYRVRDTRNGLSNAATVRINVQ